MTLEPTEAMTEKVARAIWTAEGHDPDTLYQHDEFEDWPVDKRHEYTLPGEEKRAMLLHYGWRKRDKQARAAIGAMRSSEPDDDALEQIAEFLVDQRNEPWPGGTDATRLHYWRDKAIEGARRLRALRAPETGGGS